MQYILKRILQDKDITMKLSKKILFPVLFVFITSCFLYYQYKVYNYTVLEIIFPIKNKFWLHRTNDISRLHRFKNKYCGFEIDINWYEQTNEFDVSHDKRDIKYIYKLENIFKNIPKDKKIWLDFKNLTSENAEQSINKIENIIKLYNIRKQNIIIESNNYTKLKTFKDHGFYTSYYIPVDESFLKSKSGNVIFKRRVNDAILSGNIDAVSFPIEYYNTIKSLNFHGDLLTWASSTRYYMFYIKNNLKTVLNDQQVKVILVKDR